MVQCALRTEASVSDVSHPAGRQGLDSVSGQRKLMNIISGDDIEAEEFRLAAEEVLTVFLAGKAPFIFVVTSSLRPRRVP